MLYLNGSVLRYSGVYIFPCDFRRLFLFFSSPPPGGVLNICDTVEIPHLYIQCFYFKTNHNNKSQY